jgi:hypothetical protein
VCGKAFSEEHAAALCWYDGSLCDDVVGSDAGEDVLCGGYVLLASASESAADLEETRED